MLLKFLKMNYKKVVQVVVMLFVTFSISAQKTEIYTNNLKEYNHAIELYQNKSYAAAQQICEEIKYNYDNLSEQKANCEYYIANSAIRLGQQNADELMQNFVDKYPTSTKRNGAFLDIADYYFKTGKYAYAAKWYSKVKTVNLSIKKEEEFNFNYGYSLFATKNFKETQSYFLNLLSSCILQQFQLRTIGRATRERPEQPQTSTLSRPLKSVEQLTNGWRRMIMRAHGKLKITFQPPSSKELASLEFSWFN